MPSMLRGPVRALVMVRHLSDRAYTDLSSVSSSPACQEVLLKGPTRPYRE